MTAFPQSNSEQVDNTHLLTASSQPKDARADLLDCVNKLNQVMQSYNDASGICGLGTDGLIETAKLNNKIDNTALQDNAVKTDNIKDANNTDSGITNAKIRAGTINTDRLAQVTTTIPTSNASDSLIPTQKAVSDFSSSLITADDIKYFARSKHVIFLKIGWTGGSSDPANLVNATCSNQPTGVGILDNQGARFMDGTQSGDRFGYIGSAHPVATGELTDRFDQNFTTHPLANNYFRNFLITGDDRLQITNEGTYKFEIGYVKGWTGDDNDGVQSGEGYDFRYKTDSGVTKYTKEIRGNQSGNWDLNHNFTASFSGGGDAHKLRIDINKVGSGDFNFPNTVDNSLHMMVHQTSYTTAMNNKWS